MKFLTLKILKGIILHGGHGTRLRPLTHTGPKQLLPIANKPMSQYALEDLKKLGITDIGIIVGGINYEKVQEFYGNGSQFGVKITYVYQDQPKGIAHAISLCKDFVGNSNFIVYLGDNILQKNLSEYVKKFELSESDAMILLCKVDDPSRFGIAEINKNNEIEAIVEKPKIPKSDLAVIGVYFLTPKIFDIIATLKPSWRNELEITEALQNLMKHGNKIIFDYVTGWWKDTGTQKDILDANKLVLETSFGNVPEDISNNMSIIGKHTSISPDSKIIDPVLIGENCTIGPSAIIGPYVSIGACTTIQNCKIENSIIMNDCKINCNTTIVDSIIANGSVIEDDNSLKRKFLLGERSKITL